MSQNRFCYSKNCKGCERPTNLYLEGWYPTISEDASRKPRSSEAIEAPTPMQEEPAAEPGGGTGRGYEEKRVKKLPHAPAVQEDWREA